MKVINKVNCELTDPNNPGDLRHTNEWHLYEWQMKATRGGPCGTLGKIQENTRRNMSHKVSAIYGFY